ncbi:hypothetical protein [uncultured Anaerofustis sp.]|uniref:hypothetical protein n=1 Tax=uncultured Anaerofustis sp. TaxID=904996 RepID=UPI0025D87249|nr:hypothetical protein [uncultured Anaerofustis sp.]
MDNVKKIKKLQDSILLWFKNMDKENIKLLSEANPKKVEKIKKSIDAYYRYIDSDIRDFINRGGEMGNILSNLNNEQKTVLYKIFPAGTDENAIEANKFINYIKKYYIKDIKNLKETMTYNPNEDIKIKRKNKLFSSYYKLGDYIRISEDKISKKFYNEYWQYTRDFENTKDKYFTKEEQEIVIEAVECSKEYEIYYNEKHKFAIGVLDKIGEAGEKLVSAGEAVGKWGDITQARVWSDNLYKDVFPQVVKEINPNLTKDEVIKESKEMTKRYIGFISSKEEIEKAMEEKAYYEKKTEELIRDLKVDVDKVKSEVGGLLGGVSSMAVNSTVKDLEKNPYIVMYDMLRNNIGKEKAAFILLYDKDELKEDRKELLSNYSYEELGLE